MRKIYGKKRIAGIKTAAICAILALLLLALPVSTAWYNELNTDFGGAKIEGRIRADYFQSGNGKSSFKAVYPEGDVGHTSTPSYDAYGSAAFEIYTAEQFHNLAWLQYMGVFDDETVHFYLSGNIDMSGYVLPPVGTAKHPFIGSFDGGNFTLSNLKICAGVADETSLSGATTLSDVGIFGYVGADAQIRNLYIDGLSVDLTGAAVNDISDPDSDHNAGAHYISGEAVAYVGYIAGHIQKAASCENVYVNNASIIGGGAARSGYGYFGCVEVPGSGETPSLGSMVAQIKTAGNNAGFGGSIDMMSLYGRLDSARTLARQSGSFLYTTTEVQLLNAAGEVVRSYAAETGSTTERNYIWVKPGESSGIYSYYNRTNAPQFIYVSGKNAGFAKVIKRYQEIASQTPAYFIADVGGTNYLELTPELAVSNSTGSSTVAWSLDENGHLYTKLAVEPYYLNRSGENLVVSASASTVWNIDQSGNCIYSSESVPYYICYNAQDGWHATPNTTSYRIHDNNAHYLSLNGSKIVNSREAGSTSWTLSDPDSDTGISAKIEGIRYYLGVDKGALVLSTSPVIWSKTEDSYHTESGGIDYYLAYDKGWKAVPVMGYIISGGGNDYLSSSSSSDFIVNLASPRSNSLWQLSDPEGPSTSIYMPVGGKLLYLGVGGGLTLNDTPFTWSRDSKGFYAELYGVKAYLSFNSNWGITLESWFEFSSNGVYMSVNGARDGIASADSAALESAKWQIENPGVGGQIYSVIGGVKYPLVYTDRLGLGAAGSSGTVWSYSAARSSYYISAGGQNYYLTYTDVWTVLPEASYLISGGGHYIGLSNGALSGVSSAAAAARCSFSSAASGANPPSGRISIEEGSYKYYLSYLQGQGLQLAQSASSASNWLWDSAKSAYYCTLGGTRYYLHYDDEWKADVISRFSISDASGLHYLAFDPAAGSISDAASSDAEPAGWQLDKNAASTYIYRAVKGRNYYLALSGGNLAISDEPFIWAKDGDSYHAASEPSYYIGYDNGWKTLNMSSFKIHSGANYLGTNGFNIVNRSEAAAGAWAFSSQSGGEPSGTISTLINGTRYYLVYKSGGSYGLSLETSPQNGSWSFDAALGNYYVNVGGYRYYLCYKKVSQSSYAWCVSELTYRIKSAAYDNYLSMNNWNEVMNSVSDYDSEWIFSDVSNVSRPQGTIRNVQRGYYLSVRRSGWFSPYHLGSSLSSGTVFVNMDNGLRTQNSIAYYIYYSSGSWDVRSNNPYSLSIIRTVQPTATEQIIFEKPRLTLSEGSIAIEPTVVLRTENPAAVSIVKKTADIEAVNIQAHIFSLPKLYTMPVDDVRLRIPETTQKEWRYLGQTGQQPGGQPSYFPLRLALANEDDPTSFYSDYRVSPKNTGYILSGAHQSAYETTYNADIRVSSYPINNISASYSQSANSFSTLYTIDSGGQKVVAAQNSFVDLENSRKKLLKVLNGQSNVYGLHFMNAEISRNNLVVADQVTVLGNTYHYYEMPEDSIDFHLIERGTISFFAGTYFVNTSAGNTYRNDAFFSIHEIKRNANNKITDIKEIREVWRHRQLKTSAEYIYKYSDGSYSSPTAPSSSVYEKVFDAGWITGDTVPRLTDYAVYYFEIPCNKGEYALGSVRGKTGAYLMYLDIAANGGDSQGVLLSSEGNDLTESYTVEYRSYDETVDRSILQFAVNAPAVEDSSDFTVHVSFDDSAETVAEGSGEYDAGLYTITVDNKSGSAVDLYVLICDNDNDPNNKFPYAYRVVYKNSAYGSEQIIMDESFDHWKSVNGFTIPSNAAAFPISF